MGKLCVIVCMLVLGTTSAIQFGDYEQYSDLKHEELGHWKGLEADQNTIERGENHHHGLFHSNSGEAVKGDSKAGGHIKHHVTKGYKDFHHKDEVGHTTRYIDSSGDSGDHHRGQLLRDRWASNAQAGARGDHYESEFKSEKGGLEKKVSQQEEDYRGKTGEFLHAKKPIAYDRKFYSHVPLQYVPYPHYFY